MNRLLFCPPLAALSMGLAGPALGQASAPLTGRMATPPAAQAMPAAAARNTAGRAPSSASVGQAALAGPPAEAYALSGSAEHAQAPASPASAGASPAAVTSPRPATSPVAVVHTRRQVGDVTALLLAAQADGRRAGPALPMLGPTANAAWKRYLDSYSHPIPEWFQEKVEDRSP